MTHPPRVLAIAGSDSSGGAGIQADIKTIAMLGGYAMTAVTALTAQNTLGVMRVDPVSPEMVGAQIDACLSDVGVDAIKIGMLGSPAIAALVADRLASLTVPIVFDPVMAATSGSVLADAETVGAFERLMALATLTTPNVAELAALGGEEEMWRRGIGYLGKGGDAAGDEVTDCLFLPGQAGREWSAPRIGSGPFHGTGCTLSSAIATLLGKGCTIAEAVEGGRRFVRSALEAAPGFGTGAQPLGHAAVRGQSPS